MPEITLVKNNENKIVGLSQADKKSWVLFRKQLNELEYGEMCVIKTNMPRIGAYHRFHMKLEQTVFQSQERIESFEQFRNWLKVGAGFVDWMAGPKGGVIPIPKSISYADCEEGEMRVFHNDAIAFLRTPHATKYLWKHLSPVHGAEMIESILSGFER
jgi:hypothetical protein